MLAAEKDSIARLFAAGKDARAFAVGRLRRVSGSLAAEKDSVALRRVLLSSLGSAGL